ncbi:MAG: restriction endonuclease subunit S [Lactococcus lactis]|nr:restriction endonuclease subunit S [Lactococcus lactis]
MTKNDEIRTCDSVSSDGSLLKLIQGADVEWKTLSSVDNIVTLNRGRVISKTYLQENVGDYPVYSSQTENNGEIGKIATFDYDKECLTWTTDGANAGTVFHRSGKFSVTNVCGIITINDESYLSYRFLYYWLSIVMKSYVYAGMGNPKLMSNQVERIKIPIPSLEIQQKVVKILDKMTDYVTELTAELTAELTLRQKQYSYYRDKLLTFPSQSDSDESLSVRWLKMGEFGEFIRGNGMQKKDFVESGFPAIHYGQIYTKYGLTADETFTFVTDELASKLKIADKNDLIIATTSENVEDILKPLAWLGGKVAIGGHESLFRHNENVKYLAYYFQTTEFQQMKQKYIVGTKVKDISKENLSNLTVPIPPLTEQKRIVEILDKFDKLTSDLTDGLPHEIELRQKQYEYWREQLLSFKKE